MHAQRPPTRTWLCTSSSSLPCQRSSINQNRTGESVRRGTAPPLFSVLTDERSTPARRKYRQFTRSYKRTNELASIDRRSMPANNPLSQSVSHRCYMRSCNSQITRCSSSRRLYGVRADVRRDGPVRSIRVHQAEQAAGLTYCSHCFQVVGRTRSGAGSTPVTQRSASDMRTANQRDTTAGHLIHLVQTASLTTTTMWIIQCRVAAPSIPRAPSSLR